MPACMTYIVISTFIKRYLKAKRARAPAYSRALRLIKEGFPKWGSGEAHVRCRNVEFQLSTHYTSAKWRIRIWSLSSQTFRNISLHAYKGRFQHHKPCFLLSSLRLVFHIGFSLYLTLFSQQLSQSRSLFIYCSSLPLTLLNFIIIILY